MGSAEEAGVKDAVEGRSAAAAVASTADVGGGSRSTKLLPTFTVTNTADSGTGSLRYEIGLANANAGANTIDFDNTVFNTAL